MYTSRTSSGLKVLTTDATGHANTTLDIDALVKQYSHLAALSPGDIVQLQVFWNASTGESVSHSEDVPVLSSDVLMGVITRPRHVRGVVGEADTSPSCVLLTVWVGGWYD